MKQEDTSGKTSEREEIFPHFFSPNMVRLARKELRSGLWGWETLVFLILAALPVLGMCAGFYEGTIAGLDFLQDVLTGLGIVAFLWYLPAWTLFSCARDRGGRDFLRLLPQGELGWVWGCFGTAILRWLMIALILFLFLLVEYSMTGFESSLMCFCVLLCASVILIAMSIWVAETNWYWRALFCLFLGFSGGYPLVYTLGHWVNYVFPGNHYFPWVRMMGYFWSWLPFVALQTGVMVYAFLVLASRTAFSSFCGQAIRLRRIVWLQGGCGVLLFFLSGIPGTRFDVPLPYFTGVCLVFTALLFWADMALGLRPLFVRSLCGSCKWFRYLDCLKFPGWQSGVLDFGALCLLCSIVSIGGYRWNGYEAGMGSIVLWFPLLFWANCVFVFIVIRLLFRSYTPQMLPVVIGLCAVVVFLFGHAFQPDGMYSSSLGLVPVLNLALCRERVPVSWGAVVFIVFVLVLYGGMSWRYWKQYAAFVRKRHEDRESR